MHFRYLLSASIVLATAATHAADSKDSTDARRTVTVAEPQLSAAPLGPRLGLLEAQKAHSLAQRSAAALGNAVSADGATATLTAVQRTVVARPNETKPALASDNNETASSPSVAWPLLLGLLLVFLRRAPQRFRSNGL
jgi:hypothetical protein